MNYYHTTSMKINLWDRSLHLMNTWVKKYQLKLSKIYSKTKLLWVGNGPLVNEVKKTLEAKGLLKNVIFTGVRSDVNMLLQAMDVFIFPSYYEGLGIVALEAQATGLPTFCSEAVPKEAGITEYCHFLPLGDYAKWAKIILDTHQIRKDMYKEIVKSGYDVNETSKYLQEFYLSHWK